MGRLDDCGTVAILMATYNGERFIGDQLKSIARQTYEDWLLIVSDDGSTDNTMGILNCFIESHPGKVKILPGKGPGEGACANFFRLMKECPRGMRAYMFCDQDDWWFSDKIALSIRQLERMECTGREEGQPLLAFCDARVVDANRRVISPSFFAYTDVNPYRVELNNLLVQNPVSGAEIIINEPLLNLASSVERLDGIAMHDQWISLVAAAFGVIGHIDAALFDYRQHSDNEMGAVRMSLSNIVSKAVQAKESIRSKQSQAKVLVESYRRLLSKDYIELIEQFVNLGSIRWFSAIEFLFKYDVMMHGFLRNMGLCISIRDV